jgi:PTS system sucrose-specific IIC component
MNTDNGRIAELAEKILEYCGGKDNIVCAVNCMTRVRVTTKNDGAIRTDALRDLEGVLSVVHDRENYVEIVVGPGKSRECVSVLRGMGIPEAAETEDDGAESPEKHDGDAGKGIRDTLKTFGRIFAPLIPGIIAAGLCAGLAALIGQIPGSKDSRVLSVICQLLTGVNATMVTFLTAWAGYRAAEVFGGTPILGGMLGMFTTLGNVDEISKLIGLYNEAQPLNAILRAGRGGILAAVAGVWILCKIEKAVRRRIRGAMDVVFSPLLTLLASLVLYVFVLMPALGLVSTGLCKAVEAVSMSESAAVRMIAGFVSAMIFLPMVATGMHHGLIALYTVQLESLGYVTLYPALAMAGAGQVGAALAIAMRARNDGNRKLLSVINGALPAGILGIGEPLIYGVTMPLGKPFLTAGIGAGFGGAFVMLMRVASTTWGPSGILGVFVMTEGPNGALASVACYLAGLLISCAAGYILTAAVMKKDGLPAAH